MKHGFLSAFPALTTRVAAVFLATLAADVATATAARAQPMSAAEFDSYTQGKTLTFKSDGTAYGIEQYLRNKRVRWSFIDGECTEGVWYEDNGLICFVYDNNPEPQCWTFERGAGGLIARFATRPDPTILYEALQSDEPLICLGPKVGV